MISRILLIVVVLFVSGCSKVIVEPYDPGKYTEGLRFYRPEPYLLVSQVLAADKTPTGAVQTQIVYLPNHQEEYVIRERAWLGSVSMKPTLADGWNLTALEAPVDTKIPETITALVGAAQSAASGGVKSAATANGDVAPGLYKLVFPRDGPGIPELHGPVKLPKM